MFINFRGINKVHNSKNCFKCGELKDIRSFYKHKMMSDGYLNKCKDCCKREAKENRNKNLDYYIEYDKSRAMLPHRVEARRSYSKTDKGKLSRKKSINTWIKNNIVKRAAHIIVNNAIRSGALVKSKMCENCGNPDKRIIGHHDNYSYPLSVRWLCSKCHRNWHKENWEGIS